MRIIELDASNWTSCRDFYDAILAAVGAPKWHGDNVNALEDSMIWGGINEVEPPYTIRVTGTAKVPKPVRDEIELAKYALSQGRANFRAERGADVDVQLETYP